MLVTPSLTYPTSAPVALGGTTIAAQITATRGIIAAQVSKGSAVYAVLRWNTGLNRWETVRRNGAAVTVEPTIAAALGEASTEFSAIPSSYYTALLTTSQPDGSASNLVGIAIQDAGVPASVPSVVALSPDVTGPSNANTVVAMQHNPIDSELLDGGDTGKALIWSGAEWAATALPGGGATPSDDPPLEIGTPDPGVSAEYSRGDHVHDLPEVADPGTTQYPASIEVDAKGRVLNLIGGTAPVVAAPNPYFSDGSDGAVDLDGVATFAFASLAGSTYTLSRTLRATTVRVRSGITLSPMSIGATGTNFPIRGTVSITVDAGGVVSANGKAGSGITGGAYSTGAGSLGVARNGGNGSAILGNGTAGLGGSITVGGGSGGAGGNAGLNTGGAGGVAATAATGEALGGIRGLTAATGATVGPAGSATSILLGGCGGGGGACDGINAAGGGGGQGGNPLVLSAPQIINNGTIQSRGGNGAAGATAGDGSGNAGGGAGGGGGVVCIYGVSFTGNSPDVSGGIGAAGFNAGLPGTDGTAGSVISLTGP
jgi:hypothetical protein